MFRRGMIWFVFTLTAFANVRAVHAQTRTATANLPTDPGFTVIPYSVPTSLHDRNGSLLWGHPDIDPPHAPPGWFIGMQVNIVGPAVMQHIFGQVTRGVDTVDVVLPSAPLNWVGAPQIELGYRFPDAMGELVVNYRLLATQGRSVFPGFDAAGDAHLRSRLDSHVTFAEYASREFSLWPLCDMKAHVGACVPSIYLDSHAFGALRETRFSSYYFGAGPVLGFDFWRQTPLPGLELYAQTRMSLTVGWIQQRFEESLASPGLPTTRGFSDLRVVREVPMAHLQAGVSYTPPLPSQQLRLIAGYTLERWWYLAQTDDSRGELTVQGLFCAPSGAIDRSQKSEIRGQKPSMTSDL